MISIIAAIGKNNELGLNNQLIWHLKEDMKFFKTLTTGKIIIMGRKCFESMPGLLQDRENIIITQNKDYKVDKAKIFHSIKETINYIESTDKDIFIIGGAKIYEEFLPIVENIYLTEIDATSKADVFFPNFNKEEYEKEILDKKEENNIKYIFSLYRKKV